MSVSCMKNVIFLACKYRLLHDIFHIGPGIIPRLPYQPKAIAEGLYGSRDETSADMENVMF